MNDLSRNVNSKLGIGVILCLLVLVAFDAKPIIALCGYIAISLGILVVQSLRYWKLIRAAKKWSLIEGRFEGGAETQIRGRGTRFLVQISYSYPFGNTFYGGSYEQLCEREEEAREVLRNLSKKPLYVRVDGNNPEKSLLIAE
ncbi:MAG: DUF3592 domain-containing protein [Acidobacteriota bacterium]|nr:DUF3592 domain-containing protein [Acidobacteriota bacterium]